MLNFNADKLPIDENLPGFHNSSIMCDNKTTYSFKVAGHTKGRKFKLTYEWKIENFSLIGKKPLEYLETSVFTAMNNNDVKWKLRLYPKGVRQEMSNYVSVYLQLCPTDKVKEIEADVIMYIPSISNKNKLIASSIMLFTCDSPLGVEDFIKRSDLLKNDDILINDCLTLFCDIAYCVDVTTSSILEFNTESFMPCNCKLQDGYKSLFNSQELSDVVLAVSDKELHAHKAILAAHSPVFLAMFNKDTKENISNRVEIVDIDCKILQEILRFIYSGQVENIETVVNDLLIAADKYNIKVLKDECEKYLCNKLCVDNVVEMLSKADMHNALVLKKYAINFFISHKNELVDTDAFESIGHLQPQTVVEINRGLILQ